MSFVYDFLKSCGVFWVSTVNLTDCPSDNLGPACSYPIPLDNTGPTDSHPISPDNTGPTDSHPISLDNTSSACSYPISLDNIRPVHNRSIVSENANKSFSALPRFFRPVCRPFGAVAEYSGHLYISTGSTKEVYKQFKDLPYIQITALKAETREWLRLDATVEERTALSEKKMMLKNCPALKKRFSSPDDPCFALFRLKDCRAFVHTDDGVKEI